jgi:hypothetical protein
MAFGAAWPTLPLHQRAGALAILANGKDVSDFVPTVRPVAEGPRPFGQMPGEQRLCAATLSGSRLARRAAPLRGRHSSRD